VQQFRRDSFFGIVVEAGGQGFEAIASGKYHFGGGTAKFVLAGK